MTLVNENLLLRCGTFIDGTGANAAEDIAIEIDGGAIKSIAPWRDWEARVDQVSAFKDLTGRTVIPGLIDGHTHICLGASRNEGGAATGNDPVGIVAWGLASGVAALLSGVTTVLDAGSQDGLALRVAALVNAGLAAGPRILAVGPAITTTAGHGPAFGTAADSAVEIVRAVRKTVAAGADFIKIMVTGGAITPKSNRRRAQYSQAELDAAIDDAHRLGKSVIGHANATEGITRAVRAGIDIVAHCNWLGSTPGTIEVDFDTVDAMVRQGVWIDLNIEGAFREFETTDGVVVSKTDDGIVPSNRWELLKPLRARGVGLYLTSDGFGPNVGSFTSALCEARSVCDISAEELISLVSGKPAEALGLDAEIGSLQVGKSADLVVLDGDLRKDPQALLRPVSVYRGGAEVVSGGMLRPPSTALQAGAAGVAQQEWLDSVFRELD